MKKSIVIWGAGTQGRAAYYRLNKQFNIIGFLDSDSEKKNKKIVDGKRVLDQEKCKKKFYIVIACGRWMDVAHKLQEKGLNFLVDFIPYNMFLKKNIYLNDLLDDFGAADTVLYLKEVKKTRKIALIYGNCQTEIISNMLEYNNDFEMQYMLVRVPQIHLYRDEDQIEQIFYKNKIMQLIDLFIYQNVRENNRFYPRLGTDMILKQFNNHCRKMPIHNIYFDGYFVQYDANNDRYFQNLDQKDFPYTDGIVNTLLEEGKSVSEILDTICNENLYSEEEIQKKCKQSIENLKHREKYVEVPIVDYIENNYMKEQLFYTYNHPKNIVIYEYVKRILKALEIDKFDDFTEEELNMEFGTLRINNFPIFPCVIKSLGLKKYESKVRISHISPKLIGIEEYIREYIYRCYGIE